MLGSMAVSLAALGVVMAVSMGVLMAVSMGVVLAVVEVVEVSAVVEACDAVDLRIKLIGRTHSMLSPQTSSVCGFHLQTFMVRLKRTVLRG